MRNRSTIQYLNNRFYKHPNATVIRFIFILFILLLASNPLWAQEFIGVYVSPPGEMEFDLAVPPYVPATMDFNGLSGSSWATPNYTSPIGIYSQTSGTSSVGPDDQYGAGTSDYLSIQENGVVTIDLDGETRYFGFAWPAGNDGNTVEVFNNGVSLFSINTATIVDFLPNDGTVRTSLDGTNHTSSDYYGKPGTGENSGEPYAYVHIVASEGLSFDEVRVSHATGSSAFETDNHTVLFTGQQPDVDGTDLDFIEVYRQAGPTSSDDQSLDNTPETPVTIDVVANDTAGDSPLDATTVVITGSTLSGSTLAPDGKTLTVPGEGVWTVNATTGEITFTPYSGFYGDPTPIEYRLSDTDGIASNISTVTVTYTNFIEALDDSAGPVDGITGTTNVLNVFDNDSLNGELLTPSDITLTEVDSDPELTLNSDGSVDVEPNTPDGTYTVDYQICEDASPTNCDTAIATVTVQSTITTQLTGGSCWRMLSSPAASYTYDDLLGDLWTQGATGSDYPVGSSNVFVWDNSVTGNTGGWTPPNMNDEIPSGTGVLISVFTDDDSETPGSWPKTLSVSALENTAPITVNSGLMNENGDGWTLLGNPFKTPIDFSQLTVNDITGVAYVYDRTNSSWVSTTSDSYGDITDGVISPFQGFFVQNSPSITSPSVVFPASSRATGGEFYGKEKDEKKDFVRLEIQGEFLFSSMWIRFTDEGSQNKVQNDAIKLMPLAEDYAVIASRKEDGTLVDIGHYPYPEGELQIPVHLETTQNGTFTITATDLDLPATANLYFVDQQTQQSILIDDQFEYQFTINGVQKSTPDNGIIPCSNGPQKAKTTGSDRFLITSSAWGSAPRTEVPTQTSLQQNYPNPFNPATVISYQLSTNSEVRLEVFDMLGRQVATLVEGAVEAGNHQVNFDASNLTSGVYLYRLTASGINGANQIFTKKLTLIK